MWPNQPFRPSGYHDSLDSCLLVGVSTLWGLLVCHKYQIILVVWFLYPSKRYQLQAKTSFLGLLGIQGLNKGTMSFPQLGVFIFSPHIHADVKKIFLEFWFMVSCLVQFSCVKSFLLSRCKCGVLVLVGLSNHVKVFLWAALSQPILSPPYHLHQ